MGGIVGRNDKSTGPWSAQAPYLNTGFEQAQQQFLDNPNPYTDQYANALGARASGSLYEKAGGQQLAKTLQGDYLYGGPGFNAAYQAASNKIIPQVASNFEKFGRHGSPAEMAAATGALGDAFAGLYNQERQRQVNAVGQIPGLQGADYRNIGALGQAGDVNRQLLERYMRMVGQRYGATEEGGGSNPLASGIGGLLQGGLSGALVGSKVGAIGGVPGMIGGGLLGGLGGLLT